LFIQALIALFEVTGTESYLHQADKITQSPEEALKQLAFS
jgi:uncharacterized protein YyaL (SSP411 family)